MKKQKIQKDMKKEVNRALVAKKKKILFMSSAKLTALSIGLLLAVFCTIGMSFTPAEEGENMGNPNDSTYVTGPRRSHWTTSGDCGSTNYHNKTDYARTVAKSMNVAYGTVEITAKLKGSDPVTAADGSQSYVDWDTGIGSSETTDERKDLEVIHTNTFTFTATPTDPEEYYFVGWYSDAGGNTQVSTDNPWEDVEVKFDSEYYTYSSSHPTKYESSSSRWTLTYYAKFDQIPPINVTFLAASTPARDNGYYTVAGKGVSETITTSNQTIGVKGITLTAHVSEMAEFVRWYTEDGVGNRTTLSEENPCVTSFTAATKVGVEWRELTNHHKITFLSTDVDANGDPVGSYTVDAQTVNTSNYLYNTGDVYKYSPTLTATQASDYIFTGWYTKHGKKKDLLSTSNPWNPTFTQDSTIYAGFAYNNYTDDQKAQFKVGSTYYTDLNAANSAAGSNGTIICTRDGILPPGNYTISSGVKLYIPYSTSETSQTVPKLISQSAPALSPYRKLIMVEGANINCNGTICVGGQITSMGGGSFSGYPVGACGILDMSKGGHIELNDGSVLYAWGFIKGQDMDQGNNAIGAGTITANSGAKVYEDFSGENRGGSACSALAQDGISLKSFPFQGYTIQNIEVPVTYKFGSTLQVYTALYIRGDITKDFPLISSSGALFLLKNSKSIVTKWYDPTSDLACYQLSGTAQLDAINTTIYVDINSADFNLPISSNMHIILDDCNMTLSNPIQILPDAIIEIRDNATVTLASNLFLYDVDDWKKGVASGYFAKFNNLTSHKDRGAVSSKEMLSDAKLIVDGTLNVTGKIYSTAGGANICGNGGGKMIYPASLASSSKIYQCWGAMGGTQTYEGVACANTYSSITGTKTYVHSVDVNTANLHNEDDSYTKSIASTIFYNVHGRWFTADDKDEKENHTYKFTYITSGAVSGTGGTSDWTPAVYSWDKKAALDLTQKWHNVTADVCSNWWVGTDTYFYNWTENSDWHQFIPTATEGMYSGSNNKIYTKTDCVWEELGETDVNCLYTIGGVKKALVEGQFLELVANAKDPAYHLASDENRYFICFSGCNWHEATKYENAEKAYVVDEDIFIWYDGAWMNAEWRDPFFYTLDETNVPIYYEYLNEEWVLSDPYIRVVDGLENRTYWFLDEAFAFASGSLRTSPMIKILRDIPAARESAVYTATNTTCTLDLNNHTVTSTCEYLLNINAKGSTFIIVDNSAEKKGELRACPSGDARKYGYKVTAGTLKLQSGKMYATNAMERKNVDGAKNVRITGMTVAGGATFTIDGGDYECIDEYNNYGIEVATNGVVNLKSGSVFVHSTVWYSTIGIYLNRGTLNMSGGTLKCSAVGNEVVQAVYVNAAASYTASSGATSKNHGTLNLSGGSIIAESPKNAYGVFVNRAVAVASTTDRTIKEQDYGVVVMTGGSITANATTGTNARGIYTYGTVTISGGTITATVQKSNQNTAYGVLCYHGNTTISGSASVNANAPSTAYGVYVTGDINGTYGYLHQSDVTINGGTITANTTNTTKAYPLYVTGATKAVANAETAAQKVFNGDYAAAGKLTINDGRFYANAKTTTAMGVFVNNPRILNAASAAPVCTVNGGYYKATGTGDLKGCNADADPANFQIKGGYYSHNGGLATYAVSPKQVVTLLQTDPNRPDYEYKVAEAYTVTFKNGDTQLQSGYQEVGKAPVYEGDAPTKASTTTASYVFDGWSTTDGGALVSPLPALTSAGATYYAHFAETTLKYMATFDAKTNGGNEDAQVIYVEPAAGVGTLPTATKTGYTFNGWYTAASGGAKITSATVPTGDVTYFAQFSVNSYTLTWNLDGGTVSTAGKFGSTSWPAKNATGVPSVAVPYGSALTAPAVTKTGYTFVNWGGAVAATMPAEALTYTAAWRANTNTKYTVKHYQQNVDGTYPTEPTETESLTGTTAVSVTPAVKSYEGFISPATQTKTIAADGTMVVEYQYRRIPYTIEWNAHTNGGTCETPSNTVLYGATLGSMPTATKTGLRFDGWYTQAVGGVQITETTPIMQNYGMLYAQFVEVPTYSVTFDANGHGTAPDDQEIEDGEKVTKPTDPSEAGYTFGGWYKESTCTNAWDFAKDVVTGETTLFAKWTANEYTITFNSNGGSAVESITQDYGTAVTAPANPTREGYTFANWSPEVPSTMPLNGTTCVAQWTPNTNTAYTVKHYQQNLDGTYPSTPTETDNLTGTTGASVTPARKSYEGFEAPAGQTVTILADGSRVVTYNYTRKSYNLSWVTDGDALTGSYTHGETKFGATITAPNTPTKTGYTFNGWTPAKAETMPAAATTYTATWTANTNTAYTVEHYWQNIADNEYTKHETVNMTGTTDATTEAVAKNYTGFEAAQPFVQGTVAPDGSTVVKIYYDRKTYTITWEVWLSGNKESSKVETLRYGAMPFYGADPTKEQTESQIFTFSGWTPEVASVTGDQEYIGSFNASLRPYTITFVNDNGEPLQSSPVNYGSTPKYNGSTPVSSHTGDGYVYEHTGWKPAVAEVTGTATYTATYSRSKEQITVNTEETVTDNTSATTTTVENGGTLTVGNKNNEVTLQSTTIIVESGGQLDVKDGGSVDADVFELIATHETITETNEYDVSSTTSNYSSGQVDGSGKVGDDDNTKMKAYFKLSHNGGFKARQWYAVAVPWQIAVPTYQVGGVAAYQNGAYKSIKLGSDYDLVRYDGGIRSQRGNVQDCWVYVEDDIDVDHKRAIMYPGVFYMVYLAQKADTLRFERASGTAFRYDQNVVSLAVQNNDPSSATGDDNWNGIANPTMHYAYVNANATFGQQYVVDEDGHGSYDQIKLTDNALIVGQPVFVQTTSTSVVVNKNHSTAFAAHAPRRVSGTEVWNTQKVEVQLVPKNLNYSDRVFIQTEQGKADRYTIGADLAKAGVSAYKAQMWINRYDHKLCYNTIAPINNSAYYPLGISIPKAGEYAISVPEDCLEGDNIYLTIDGRVVWNLSFSPYVADFEQGTTTRYGIRLVRSLAPEVTTDIENAGVTTEELKVQKILLDDQVYILRGGNMYSVEGQMVK